MNKVIGFICTHMVQWSWDQCTASWATGSESAGPKVWDFRWLFICQYFLNPSHRDRMLMFEELSDIFSDHNNHLTSRELLMKVSLLVGVLGHIVSALESLQGESDLRAPYIPPVPWESLKGLEGRDLVYYAKSKELPENWKSRSSASWLHNQNVKLVLLCVSLWATLQIGGWEALEYPFSAEHFLELQRPSLQFHILYLDYIAQSTSNTYWIPSECWLPNYRQVKV